MKQIVLVVCLLYCCACEKKVVTVDIETEIAQSCLNLKSQGESSTIRELVYKINTISNKATRITFYNLLIDGLMSLDISDSNYHQQGNIISRMWDLVCSDIADGMIKADLTILDVWDVKIRTLGWQRKQLERLKPTGPLPDGLEWDGNCLNILNQDVNRKYTEWLGCYKSSARNYESHIRHLEGHTFYIDTLRSTEEEKEKLREMLRKYIGRPIRSEEELRRDAKNRKAMEFPYDGWFEGKGPLKL